MKPAPFDYVRALDVEEALEALAGAGDDARVLAGGQSLGAMLNMRLVRPRVLVDISGIDSLAYARDARDAIEVGASLTQAALEETEGLAARVPLLAQALPWVGHYQTRARGTICGSIAHADPSSELPLCLAVLDGRVCLRSARTRRQLSAHDFLTGILTTQCSPEELVERVCFPVRQPGTGYAFREFGVRRGDFAIVAVAAAVSEQGIRLGVGGAAQPPVVRDWSLLEGDALDDALNELAWELPMQADVHAPARYRRELLRRLGRKAVEEARACRG